MATETDYLREAIKAQGGSCDDLPDNLESTLYKKLIETCAEGGGGSGGGSGMHIVAIAGVVQSDDTGWDCYYEKSSYEEVAEAVIAGKVVILQFKLPSGGANMIGTASTMVAIQVEGQIFGLNFSVIMGDVLLSFVLNQDGSITCESSAA